MVKTLFEAANDRDYGHAVLYAGALGLILSDVIPTPADALYFRLTAKNKAKLESGDITPKQYWTRDLILYYGLNPLWWTLVLGAMVATKGDFSQKAKIGVALLAGGAVIGVISKNINEERSVKSV